MSEMRFHVAKGGDVTTTDWEVEIVKAGASTAAARATELRTAHGPDAAIMIERRGDERTPNKLVQCRFQIKDGENLYYSKLVNVTERDILLAQLREMYPKAEITEATNG